MIVDNIVKYDNEFVSLVKERKLKTPLVLWGAGIIADRLSKFLRENEIVVAAYVVNKEYYREGLSVCGQKVYNAAEYFLSLENKCTLVIAHNGYQKRVTEPYMDKIEQIYVYDFCGMFTMGPLNVMTQSFITENREQLDWLDRNLSDELSKDEITNYINQKITGVYRTEYFENQYFVSDVISLEENEIFIDCGAFTGDSIESFVANLKKSNISSYRSLYAFEPDGDNCESLKKNLSHLHDLHVIAGGAWNESGTLSFDTEANTGSKISESGTTTISVYTIDEVLEGKEATFIKMDIEGSELEALHGAEKTIRAYKPKLAICVYHKNEDIFEIPKYIKSLVPEYRLYYRKHAETATEMVLYAVI